VVSNGCDGVSVTPIRSTEPAGRFRSAMTGIGRTASIAFSRRATLGWLPHYARQDAQSHRPIASPSVHSSTKRARLAASCRFRISTEHSKARSLRMRVRRCCLFEQWNGGSVIGCPNVPLLFCGSSRIHLQTAGCNAECCQGVAADLSSIAAISEVTEHLQRLEWKRCPPHQCRKHARPL
jgi:hypothetical protein